MKKNNKQNRGNPAKVAVDGLVHTDEHNSDTGLVHIGVHNTLHINVDGLVHIGVRNTVHINDFAAQEHNNTSVSESKQSEATKKHNY